MTYQLDWSDAFENGAYIPGAQDLPAVWAARAAAFRDQTCCDLDLAYGPHARHRLDLFHPVGTPKGCVVFFHGGYWHRFDKSSWSHLAAGPLARGWAVAMPSYPLAPEVRIAEITRAAAWAVEWVAAQGLGPLRLIGHSAGGHLVSRLLCPDAAPAAAIERVVSLSGLHDLRPLLHTRMNDTLGLDLEEATAESPALHTPAPVPTVFWTGAEERPEFLRQARLAAEAWGRKGAPAHAVFEPGQNHFTIIDGLARPDSPLTGALLDG